VSKLKEILSRASDAAIVAAERAIDRVLYPVEPRFASSGRVVRGSRDGSGWGLEIDHSRLLRRDQAPDVPVRIVASQAAPVLRSARISELAQTPPDIMQGVIGTPFTGGLPDIEKHPKLSPYEARGLGMDTGHFEQILRGNPQALDGVRETADLISQASESWEVNAVALECLRSAGVYIDPEQAQRHADLLNLEWSCNPAFRATSLVRTMVTRLLVDGFVVHEFAIDPNAPWGRTTLGIEQRAAMSIEQWIVSSGRLLGFTQTKVSDGDRSTTVPAVDINRCFYAGLDNDGLNFEGISALRPAFTFTEAKRIFLITGQIHRQRFGAGFPVFRTSPEVLSDAKAIAAINEAARTFYASTDSYVSLPPSVVLEMLKIDSETGLVPIFEYFDRQIRLSLGVQHSDLGSTGVGSYALMSQHTQSRLRRLNAIAEVLDDSMSRWARAVIDLRFGPQAVYPVHRFSGIFSRSQEETANVWRVNAEIESSGVYTTDENNARRVELGLPQIEAKAGEEDEGRIAGYEAINALRFASELAEKVRIGTVSADAARAILAEAGIQPETVNAVVSGSVIAAAAPVSAPVQPSPQGQPQGQPQEAPRSRAGAHACGHAGQDKGCGCSTRRSASSASVEVRGRDGLPFMTHRELVGAEVHVAWRSINDAIDVVAGGVVEQLRSVMEDQRAEFEQMLKPFVKDEDLIGASKIRVSREEEYREIIEKALQEASDFAAADMIEEIRAQLGGTFEPSSQDTGATPAKTIKAQARVLAGRIDHVMQDALRVTGLRAVESGVLSIIGQVALADSTLGSLVAEGVTSTISETRSDVAAELGPEIDLCRYSSVLDASTCGPCEASDGVEVEYESDAYWDINPPNQYCESVKSGSNRCRCIWIFQFFRD